MIKNYLESHHWFFLYFLYFLREPRKKSEFGACTVLVTKSHRGGSIYIRSINPSIQTSPSDQDKKIPISSRQTGFGSLRNPNQVCAWQPRTQNIPMSPLHNMGIRMHLYNATAKSVRLRAEQQQEEGALEKLTDVWCVSS